MIEIRDEKTKVIYIKDLTFSIAGVSAAETPLQYTFGYRWLYIGIFRNFFSVPPHTSVQTDILITNWDSGLRQLRQEELIASFGAAGPLPGIGGETFGPIDLQFPEWNIKFNNIDIAANFSVFWSYFYILR
jgi:hypothetical protein